MENLTDDHKKLLYLISQFSKIGKSSEDSDVWLKELALRTFVFQAIVGNVFEGYDYSPLSVDTVTGRMFLNISQEAEDDIIDLREKELVECLKLTSQSSKMISAYRVTSKGLEVNIPQEFQKNVDKFIKCEDCGDLLSVRYERSDVDSIYMICKSCNKRIDSHITGIEDISYTSIPYFPKIPYYVSYAKEDAKYGFLVIDGDKTKKIVLSREEKK